MANYTIIGGDEKEYGPITADDVRQWITEGRLNEQSMVKGEGDAGFRPLGKFSEFTASFAVKTPTGETPPPFSAGTSSPVVSERDYDLDIFGCFSRGWELLKDNMGLLFVGVLVYLIIEAVIGGLSAIPVIGALISIANLVISGPFIGGVYYLSLRIIRNEPAEVGDIFSGFRRGFGQLFLGKLIPNLLIGLCLLPFLVIFVIKFFPLISHLQHLQPGTPPDPETVAALKSVFFTSLPVLLVCAVPAIYLGVSWAFTLALIVDKGLNFWTAMQTSRRQVGKHWWQIFGLLVLISLFNLAGTLLCCVGALFTIPVGLATLMFAYETIFSERQTH